MLALYTARTVAGFPSLSPIPVFPTSITAQHTLKNADLLSNDIDLLFPARINVDLIRDNWDELGVWRHR
jgi:hypothetical protein